MHTSYMLISDFQVIKITEQNQKIIELVFMEKDKVDRNPSFSIEDNSILLECKRQLLEYFGGERKDFTVPFCLIGTSFQQSVWKELQTIPYGETRTYQQIACSLGKDNAVQAVSNAIAKNPILILIPCHRVIGKDGKLHGYSGGLELKKSLLELEAFGKDRNVNFKINK